MTRVFALAAMLAAGVLANAAPASALQTMVTQIDKNSDGSMTYHFAIKLDPSENLVPGDAKVTGDLVTLYNHPFQGVRAGPRCRVLI